jgi:hypothetical protein
MLGRCCAIRLAEAEARQTSWPPGGWPAVRFAAAPGQPRAPPAWLQSRLYPAAQAWGATLPARFLTSGIPGLLHPRRSGERRLLSMLVLPPYPRVVLVELAAEDRYAAWEKASLSGMMTPAPFPPRSAREGSTLLPWAKRGGTCDQRGT